MDNRQPIYIYTFFVNSQYIENTQASPIQFLADYAKILSDQGLEPEISNTAVAIATTMPPRQVRVDNMVI